MKEIRMHGRGGQGSFAAAEILAVAAFEDGKISQAFPSFGSERMGAPIQTFVRLSDRKIRSRNHIYEPDYVVIMDPTLIIDIDVLKGMKSGGLVLVNTEKKPEELKFKSELDFDQIRVIPATRIAREITGKAIPNAVMMGAFAGFTKEVSIAAIKRAVMERFPGKVGELNAQGAKKAYSMIKEGEK